MSLIRLMDVLFNHSFTHGYVSISSTSIETIPNQMLTDIYIFTFPVRIGTS